VAEACVSPSTLRFLWFARRCDPSAAESATGSLTGTELLPGDAPIPPKATSHWLSSAAGVGTSDWRRARLPGGSPLNRRGGLSAGSRDKQGRMCDDGHIAGSDQLPTDAEFVNVMGDRQRGQANIAESHLHAFATVLAGTRLSVEKLDVLAVSDDVQVGLMEWRRRRTEDAPVIGAPEGTGVFSLVAHRRGGNRTGGSCCTGRSHCCCSMPLRRPRRRATHRRGSG
jgi:hypothetical protein